MQKILVFERNCKRAKGYVTLQDNGVFTATNYFYKQKIGPFTSQVTATDWVLNPHLFDGTRKVCESVCSV